MLIASCKVNLIVWKKFDEKVVFGTKRCGKVEKLPVGFEPTALTTRHALYRCAIAAAQ